MGDLGQAGNAYGQLATAIGQANATASSAARNGVNATVGALGAELDQLTLIGFTLS